MQQYLISLRKDGERVASRSFFEPLKFRQKSRSNFRFRQDRQTHRHIEHRHIDTLIVTETDFRRSIYCWKKI